RFHRARAIVDFMESVDRDRPLVMPLCEPTIKVGRFADLGRRIQTGERIFDEILSDASRRTAIYEWARAHPHTGSRVVHGGTAGPTIRQAWPVARVRALRSDIHAPAEPDPGWP